MGIQEGPIEAAADATDQPVLPQDEHHRKEGSGTTAAESCCIEKKEGSLDRVSDMEKEDQNGLGVSSLVDKIGSGAEVDVSQRGDRVEDAADDRGQVRAEIESKVEDSLDVDAGESAEEPGDSSQRFKEEESKVSAAVASEEPNAAEKKEAHFFAVVGKEECGEGVRSATEAEQETGIGSVNENGHVDRVVSKTVDSADPVATTGALTEPAEKIADEQEAANEKEDQIVELKPEDTTGAQAEVDADQESGLVSEDKGESQAGYAQEVSVSSDAAEDKPSVEEETKQDDRDGRKIQAEVHVESLVVEATVVQEVEIEYVGEGKVLDAEMDHVENGTAVLNEAEVLISETTVIEVEVKTMQVEKQVKEVSPVEGDTNEVVVKCEKELEGEGGGVETEETLTTSTKNAELSSEIGEQIEQAEAVIEKTENDQHQATESKDAVAEVEAQAGEIRGLPDNLDNQESSSSAATLSSVEDKREEKLETEEKINEVSEEIAPIQVENAGGREVSDVPENKPAAEEEAKVDDDLDTRETQQDPGVVEEHVDNPEVPKLEHAGEDKVVEAEIDHVNAPMRNGEDNAPENEAVISEATLAPEVDTKSVQVEDTAADHGEAQVESIAEVVDDTRVGNSNNEAENQQSFEAATPAEDDIKVDDAQQEQESVEIAPKEAEIIPSEVEDAVEATQQAEEAEPSTAIKVDDAQPEQEPLEVAPREVKVIPSEVEDAVKESSVGATKEAEEAGHSATTKVDDAQMEQAKEAETTPSEVEDSVVEATQEAEEAENSAATKVDDAQLEQDSIEVAPKEAEISPSEVQDVVESSVEATQEAEDIEHSTATKVDDAQPEQESEEVAPKETELNSPEAQDTVSNVEATRDAELSAATKVDDGQLEQESVEVAPREAEITPSEVQDTIESTKEAEQSAATKPDDAHQECVEVAQKEAESNRSEVQGTTESTQEVQNDENSVATEVDSAQLEQESGDVALKEAEINPSQVQSAVESSVNTTKEAEEAEEPQHSVATKVDDAELEQESVEVAPKEAEISLSEVQGADDAHQESVEVAPKEAEITPSKVQDAAESATHEAGNDENSAATKVDSAQLEQESVEMAPKEAEINPSQVQGDVDTTKDEEAEHSTATKVDDAQSEQESVEVAPKEAELNPSEVQSAAESSVEATQEAEEAQHSAATIERDSDIVAEATETENIDPDGSEGALGETKSSKENDAEVKASAEAEDLTTSTDVPEVADGKEVNINTALDNEVEAGKGPVEARSGSEEKGEVEIGDAAVVNRTIASEAIGTSEDPASEGMAEQEKAPEEHAEPASEDKTEESTSGDKNVADEGAHPNDSVDATIEVQAEELEKEPASEETAGPPGEQEEATKEKVEPTSGDKSVEDLTNGNNNAEHESVSPPSGNVTETSEAEAKVDVVPSEEGKFPEGEAEAEAEVPVTTDEAELPETETKSIQVEDAKESAEDGSVTLSDSSTETSEAATEASDKPIQAAIAEVHGAEDAQVATENVEGSSLEQKGDASANENEKRDEAVSAAPEQHDDENGEEGTNDKSLEKEPLERDEEQKLSSVEDNSEDPPANEQAAKNDEVTERQADVEQLKEQVSDAQPAEVPPENVLEQGGDTSDQTNVEKNDVDVEQAEENSQEHEASKGAQEDDLVVHARKHATELTNKTEAEEDTNPEPTEKVETDEHATESEARKLELPSGAEKTTVKQDEAAVENAETSEGEQPDFQDAVEFEDEEPSSDETGTLTNGPDATSKAADGGLRTTVRSLIAAAMSLGKAKPSKKKRLRLKKELEKQAA